MAKTHVWYICPACRSRLAVERHHTGEIRCRNCSTLLRAAKESASTAVKQGESPRDADDDEYRLAPADDDLVIKPPPRRSADAAPPVYHSELERLRARRERVADVAAPQVIEPSPSNLPFDGTAVRDDERYKPEPPPRWTFLSGVLTYPWRPQSMLPWVVLSIGIALWGAFGIFMLIGLTSGSQAGVVMAGFLGLAWIWLTILVGSYAAACVFAVTETTAYNFNAPYDWPEPDWRERFIHLLWLGWCLGLAAALVVTPSSLITDNPQDRALMIAIGIGLLLPIFVLSTLETNSLSPVSGPIWRSLLSEAGSWIMFYVVGGLLVGACGMASLLLFKRLVLLSPLVMGPLWAACTLIYARLLGRLAWRIMQPGEKQLQAWRKSHQSSLAGEARRRREEDEDPFGPNV